MASVNINLTPYEEYENKYWFAVEIVCVVLAIFLVNTAAGQVAAKYQSQIAELQERESKQKQNIEDIKELDSEASELVEENKELKDKRDGMSRVSLVGIEHVEAVMLLEFMHSLKPDGMWYKSLKIESSSKQVNVSGHVHDISIVAEFVRTLESTKQERNQNKDIRSRIYFEEISLGEMKQEMFTVQGVSKELKTHTFDMALTYTVRPS